MTRDSRLKRWVLAASSPKVGVPIAVGLLLLAAPFIYRNYQLAKLPDIGDPFDVEAFLKTDIPDEENAFVEYQEAAAMLSPMPALERREREKIDEEGWAAAPEDIRQWVLLNRVAADKWLEGTRKPDAMLGAPGGPNLSDEPNSDEFYNLTLLGRLEGSRLTEEGKADAAWKWHRGVFRYGRHLGMRGGRFARVLGYVEHAQAAAGIVEWASHRDTNSAMLQKAMRDIESDYELSGSLTECLKWDYMASYHALHSSSYSEQFVGAGIVEWLSGQPQLRLSVLRHEFARQFHEHEANRTGRAATPEYLPRAELDALIDPLDDLFLPSIPNEALELHEKRGSATQRLLVVSLAAQLSAREHGELPESAEALIGDELDAIGADPFSPKGGRLQYRRAPDGTAVVWSIGQDGIDQGGDVGYAEDHLTRDVGFRIKPPRPR